MLLYPIVLFLHIVGALGLFVTFGFEWTSMSHMHRASTVDQARAWLGVRGWVMRLGPASLGLLLLSGLFMIATSWGWTGWIVVALAALVLIAVLGATLTGSRVGTIQQGVTSESGTLSPALRQRLSDPAMWISLQTRTAIALGIVFLMTVKPDWVGSLITIGVAIILGLASSLPMRRCAQAKDAAAVSRS